ncbi:MAG: hypothetical protein ACI9GH_000484 [Candidatus Paceibacteria bacterium]|jgi:hypothetical protein
MKRFQIAIVLALLFTPFMGFAADVRSGGELKIGGTSVIEENLYVGAGTVVIDQDVNADLSVAGGTVDINSTVTGDIVVSGGTINFRGVAKDDIKIAGGTAIFSGIAEKDLVLIGGTLRVEQGSVINGDVIILGGNVFFAGEANNQTKIVAGNVFIDGNIKGDTEITTQHLIFGENAKVEGTLSYFAPEESFISDEAVTGEVMFNQIESLRDNSFVKRMILNVVSFWIVLRFITTIILAFILVYVFRFFSQSTVNYAMERYGRSFVAGIIFLIFTPIVSVVFFISLIAIPFAVLLMLAYFFITIVATGISGIFTGALVKKWIMKDKNISVSFRSAAIGVIILTLLQLLPIFGDIIRLIITVISIGAITNYLYTNVRFRSKTDK